MGKQEEQESWRCTPCGQDFTRADFLTHLRLIHQIPHPSGTRKMLAHIDFAGGYTSVYDWQIENLNGVQTYTVERVKKRRA